jgi:4-alpha-glucanotransferase
VSTVDAALAALAEFHGILARYTDADGRVCAVDADVVTALLQALGVALDDSRGAAGLLRDLRLGAQRRVLEPVLVHRVDRGDTVRASLPEGTDPGDVWLSLDYEDGSTAHGRLNTAVTGYSLDEGLDGIRVVRVEIDLSALAGAEVPVGRHRVTLEGVGSPRSSLLIAAPDCPLPRRQWGTFIPLHALRTRTDWGIGSYTDLASLGEWVEALGGSFVGTLPLYPIYPEAPVDPSPYLPVSRLAYNELFVDPRSLPEFEATPDAVALVSSPRFEEAITKVHDAPRVLYEEVARLKRAVLEPMARALWSGEMGERRRELEAFSCAHPELAAYARFRAGRDAEDGRGEPDPSLVRYHLYCQWAAFEQLSAARRAVGAYADLPIGSHPDGFDPAWSPQSFVPGVHGGAPPDRFFAGGQDWGFNPLHPTGIREDGYAFFSAALARAFRHADCLRIDHVMGLQRLYMIPAGCGGEGAYVSYRAEELHALVALEAFRAGCVVVGEDLGTVPGGVRRRMARDRMLRTWVFQFESTIERPLPDPPPNCLAALGTHDVPRFGAYLWGDDVAARAHAGELSPAEAVRERSARARWRARLFHELGSQDQPQTPAATTTALEGCLAHMARSEAPLVLVDLEELWDERRSQNHPGTGPEGGNWTARAARTLDELMADLRPSEVLTRVDRERVS